MTRNTIIPCLLLTLTITATLAAAQDASPAEGQVYSAGRLLTNDSIVRLTQANVSQETILHAVNTQPGSFALGVDDIIALKQAGVSDRVVDAMLDHSALGCGPAMTIPTELFVSAPSAGNGPGQPPGQPVPTPHPITGMDYPSQAGASPSGGTSEAPVYRYSAGPTKDKTPRHQDTKPLSQPSRGRNWT